ncbi:MAG TPA: hypothetical protein VMR20_00355 [Verrucomicrobiae bacterium]|nr:hypothetical protein [Verrucomicrobiae bacterium]
MAAGEYSLTGFMQISKLDAMKRKQAPVDWIAGPQTLATISTVAIIKNRSIPPRRSCSSIFISRRKASAAWRRQEKFPCVVE